MAKTLEGSKVINIVDSKVSKEENYKNQMASAVHSLKAQLQQQLLNQQFLSEKQLEAFELELERQALIHKSEEDLQRWLENEIAQMQRNFEAMQAQQSKPSMVAEVQENLLCLSQQVEHISALRAEFEALKAAIEPEIANIGKGLSVAEASLAAVPTLSEDEKVEKLFGLGRDVHDIHLKVGAARVKAEDLFKRVEAAKAETKDVVEVLEADLKLGKDNVFAPEEFETLNDVFQNLLHSVNVEDIITSLNHYKTELNTFDDRIQTINLGIKAQLPSNQVSVFSSQFGFFYHNPLKNSSSTPSLKPAAGRSRGEDEDELLKAIRKYSM